MQCLNISNKQVKAAVDEAAAALGSEDAAYYVISENNGYGLDYTPDGVQSILFQSLLDLYDGNRELALQAKARAYSKQFRNWFGDWEKGLTIKQDNKSYYRGQYDEPIIDKDGNLILKGKKDSLYERAGYNIEKGVSATTDMKSADEYGINQRYAYEADIEDKYGELDQSWEKEQELNEVAEHGYYLIQFSKNISNKIINEAGEVKIIDDVVIPKGQYTIEHITDESTEILATSNNNASKVVDENGEPKVMYHHTDESNDIRYREVVEINNYHNNKFNYSNLSTEQKEFLKENKITKQLYNKLTNEVKDRMFYCGM